MERSWRTEVRAGDQGPRLIKRALDDDGRSVLAEEAERLRRAAHPGVVEVIAHHDDELELAWAGDATLATRVPPLPVSAAILAAVAATVADLHGIGVVHGRLDPSHVVIDAEGCPRLCGFGPSGRTGSVDPGPAEDVAAVGNLILHLVGPEAEIEPIPEHRWRRRRWAGYQRRALQMLADQATHEDPARRPTAKALAGLIAECVPDAHFAPSQPEPAAETDTDKPTDASDDGSVDPRPDTPEPTEAASASGPDEASPGDADDRGRSRPEADEPDRSTPPRSLTWQALVAHRAASPGREDPEDLGPDHPDREPGPFAGAAGPPDAAEDRPEPNVTHVLGLPVLPPTASTNPTQRPRPSRSEPETTPMAPEKAGAVWVRRAAVLVVLAAAVVTAGRLGGTEGSAIASPRTRPSAPGTSASIASTTLPATTAAATGASGPELGADRSPELAPETSKATSPPAVHHAGVTYLVGEPGDRAVVADWECDGAPTVGLVRPATGEVFIFDGWAGKDGELTVEPVDVVPGAVGLRAPPPPDGSDLCPPLVVELTDGAVHHLMPREPR